MMSIKPRWITLWVLSPISDPFRGRMCGTKGLIKSSFSIMTKLICFRWSLSPPTPSLKLELVISTLLSCVMNNWSGNANGVERASICDVSPRANELVRQPSSTKHGEFPGTPELFPFVAPSWTQIDRCQPIKHKIHRAVAVRSRIWLRDKQWHHRESVESARNVRTIFSISSARNQTARDVWCKKCCQWQIIALSTQHPRKLDHHAMAQTFLRLSVVI